MRKVIVLRWGDVESNEPVKIDLGEALLHCFSTESCHCEEGVHIWPAAIIEWPDGEVMTVHAELVRFLEAPATLAG